ncbi:MAG: tRNA (guanosine(37)-N1)-methyltransferase TrmD [Clostridia bacterium]|nr:tRNA (guanosine(37)-N1)-methyltransferase TrmD [Clostridia bacterium]
MQIDVITIFPQMLERIIKESILKRAQQKNIVKINIHNLRDFALDKHSIVDDYSYGGGAGMVLKPEPIFCAVEKIVSNRKGKRKVRIILLTPQGQTFNQAKAKELSQEEHLLFICGHYEGVDERVKENLITDEISIGDYVLTGGELPAMVIIDSLVRILPGVLNKRESFENDSFYQGLLDYPHYTRPRRFREKSVPALLLSGNHSQIKKWRRQKALKNTLNKRSDLLEKITLSAEDQKILKELKRKRDSGNAITF